MRQMRTLQRILPWLGVAVAGVLMSRAATAQTLTPDYLGDWTIVSAELAPWAGLAEGPRSLDVDALRGKAITFAAKNIRAPRPLGCTGAKYKVESYSPDMLFEGGLTDPENQAASLGFQSTTIPTLIAGCEVEFHFIDSATALFGLNDSIYRMQRKASAPSSK